MSEYTKYLIAIACGVCVANLYYCQPLLSLMAKEFACTSTEIGLAFATCLGGYTTGLFFIVPLGDELETKKLVSALLVGISISLACVASAHSLVILYIAMFALGVFTVVPQVLVPIVATLTEPPKRGAAVGIVMSGLFFGILLSRTISGFIGGLEGWRAVYWWAIIPPLTLLFVLVPQLPHKEPAPNWNYVGILKSLGTLIKDFPILRTTCMMAALNFACFNACWASLAFYCSGAPFNYNSSEIGLFGLVGVAGSSISPIAGKLGDKHGPMRTIGVAFCITALAYSLMSLFVNSLWSLILGIILIDLACMSCQVSAQSRVYSLKPELNSKINTIYMVSYFIGGSSGAAISTWAWRQFGWNGVCGFGVAAALTALIIFAIDVKTLGAVKQVRASKN